MTEPVSLSPDPDAMLHDRIINRLAIAQDDLAVGRLRAALGALDGAEFMIQDLRTLLRLLEP